MNSTTLRKSLIVVGVAALVAGCASLPSSAELDAMTDRIVKASFRDQGIAKVDRVLATDETNRLCSQADASGKPLDDATAKRIEEANLKAVKWPSDGKFLGDWKQGEAIAQSGRGLQFSDAANTVAGGNCYACHQLTKEELSYGTIGPSLHHYGKLRGNSEPILKYTWGKIWNAHAFNACTNMPRFGDAPIYEALHAQRVQVEAG